MDLFNKKKLTALQNEYQIASAKLDAVEKDYDSLQKSVFSMYEDLSTYFSRKYKGKYLKYAVAEQDKQATEVKVKCNDAKFDAGSVVFSFELADKRTFTDYFNPTELRILTIITKKEFKEVAA